MYQFWIAQKLADSAALTGIFRWDLKGLVVLGKVSSGVGIPFGMPLDKLQWKYFSHTVGLGLSLMIWTQL